MVWIVGLWPGAKLKNQSLKRLTLWGEGRDVEVRKNQGNEKQCFKEKIRN